MTAGRPMLVTGLHRSGTTWVGRTLAEAPGVCYIHEPFSVSDAPGPGICNVAFSRWYTHIDAYSEARYVAALRNTLELSYDLAAALRAAPRAGLTRVVAEQAKFLAGRLRGSRPLIKDPIALFSAEWLARTFDADVVVLIRHPAAFASSLKKLGWRHPFEDFLAQGRLMQTALARFEPEVREMAQGQHEILDEAVLLWRMAHSAILGYRERHPAWLFLRHEDLSRDPESGFARLYQRLGLEFTPGVRQAVAEFTRHGNPVDPAAPVGSESALRRDSRASIDSWRTRLKPEEIERIRERVEDVSRNFYSSDEW
jgi:hypothetical protein